MRYALLGLVVLALGCDREEPAPAPKASAEVAEPTPAERRQAAKDEESRRLREEAEAKERDLKARLAKIQDLQDRIAAGNATEAELEEMKRELEDAQEAAKALRGGPYRRPADGSRTAPAPAPSPGRCAPGDPHCSDI